MYQWIFVCGILFAFYNAWGIGANDCANSFATSVGAKVLSLRQAVVIAAIFEFGGAVLMGSHVTDTVRKSIVSIDIFEHNPGALMYGMLCADLASALWLTTATYFKYPVSTTHSIIGAIVGFSLAYGGKDAIVWKKIGLIVASWVASPLIAGILAYCSFWLINKFVFSKSNSLQRTYYLFPVLTFFTFFINVLFIIYKGSPRLNLDEMKLWKCMLISIGIGIFTACISHFFYIPYVKKKIEKKQLTNGNEELVEKNELTIIKDGKCIEDATEDDSQDELKVRTKSYIQATNTDSQTINLEEPEESTTNIIIEEKTNNFIYNPNDSIDSNIKKSKQYVNNLEKYKINKDIEELHNKAVQIDNDSDNLCSWVQIITACFSSFAHGSNDVANAIAPLATIFLIYEEGKLLKKSEVPIWILVVGGIGIVVGLATWGYKIIDRIGRELTKITPSRGFVIELAAATTVIIASRAEIPVSTTHCQVGSVLGCGITGGLKNIKWNLVKGILFSWLITLPVTGFLSAGLFSFGYYSPYLMLQPNISNETNISYLESGSGSGSLIDF